MKTVLITGVSGALGKSIAKDLLIKGFKVVGISRSDVDFNNENYCHINFDLKNISEYKELMNKSIERFGKIEGFIHCAGIQKIMPISLFKSELVEEFFRINVISTFEIIKFLSKNKYSEKCAMVLFSSLAVHEGAPGNAFYAATKGALEGFLMTATAELIDKHRINIVVPGVLKEGMGEIYTGNLTDEQRKNLDRFYPKGLGESEDINNIVEFLITEKSKWINGQKFILDGGHLAIPR